MNLESVFLFYIAFMNVDHLFAKTESDICKLYSCDEDTFVKKLQDVQVSQPNYLVKTAVKRNISHYCKDFRTRLDNIEQYIHVCDIVHIKNDYRRMMEGADSLYYTLCLNKQFQKDFIKHSSCFDKVFGEHDDCDIPSDWASGTDETRICSAYKTIIDCHTIKATLACGSKAADVYKKFLTSIISASILVDCGPKFAPASISRNTPFNMNIYVYLSVVYLSIIFILLCIICGMCISKHK